MPLLARYLKIIVGIRKRTLSTSSIPTPASLQLWQPLLSHLAMSSRSLPTTMAENILSNLIRSDLTGPSVAQGDPAVLREQKKEVSTYRWGLAVWLIWLWRGDDKGLSLDEDHKKRLWRRLLGSLLHGDGE